MRLFARLLEQLQTAPRPDIRQALLTDYFGRVSARDRGWAVALLTGGVSLKKFSPAQLRTLLADRVDPHLMALSLDHVGDLTDSVALLWPEKPGANRQPDLEELAEGCLGLTKAGLLEALPDWLDALEASGRWTLLKLVSGDLKFCVTPREVRQALAHWSGQSLSAIEEIWHSQNPPYEALMIWLEGQEPRPSYDQNRVFYPLLAASPLSEATLEGLPLSEQQVEWKWNGLRVQLRANGQSPARLFTSQAEDITSLFPDVLSDLACEAVFDGELLVAESPASADQPWQVGPHDLLQKRLNRKRLDKALLARAPAFVRVFDLLFEAGEDLRPLPLQVRRARLEACLQRHKPAALDLSPLLPVTTKEELLALRQKSASNGCDGLVLKDRNAAYRHTEQQAPWYSWQPAATHLNTVLLYVERPAGRSSASIGSCTFGVWRQGADGEELVPLGKVDADLSISEDKALAAWVKENQREKFGPVRSVAAALVLQVSYEALHPAPRRKAGVSLKAPKLLAICWQEDIGNVARLEDLV
ncbi:cisplatin damage response ATP-dependent DNA ligase [Rhodovibrionaceae bacterium A322]